MSEIKSWSENLSTIVNILKFTKVEISATMATYQKSQSTNPHFVGIYQN